MDERGARDALERLAHHLLEPRRSKSLMVYAAIPSSFTSSRSPSSSERTPSRRRRRDRARGAARRRSRTPPPPVQRGGERHPVDVAARVVSGVFRSPCASNQSDAPGPRRAPSPPTVPSAIEWSPPSTSGTAPPSASGATSAADAPQVALISARKRALLVAGVASRGAPPRCCRDPRRRARAPRGARRAPRSGWPTGPCPRRGGRRRGRAPLR